MPSVPDAYVVSQRGLLANHSDLAVHSLKDMPTTLPDGLILGAITEVRRRLAPGVLSGK
jgi:hydroxymethylbilane synthase